MKSYHILSSDLYIMKDSYKQELYPHDLQLFDHPPAGNIALNEFNQIAIDRIKGMTQIYHFWVHVILKTHIFTVLQLVEQVSSKYPDLSHHQYAMILRKELCDADLGYYVRLVVRPEAVCRTADQKEARKRDHISHYILRMAFSYEQEDWYWFYDQEKRLCEWKCASMTAQSSKDFISIHKLNYTPVHFGSNLITNYISSDE